MARTADIRRETWAATGPSGLNPYLQFLLSDARGTNVWPTVTRVRCEGSIFAYPDTDTEVEAMAGSSMWYGVVAKIGGSVTTPEPPDINPYVQPDDNRWMDIGLMIPHYSYAVYENVALPVLTTFTFPQGELDTRAQRRFDDPDEFLSVWLVLSWRDRFGVEMSVGTTYMQFFGSVIYLQAD